MREIQDLNESIRHFGSNVFFRELKDVSGTLNILYDLGVEGGWELLVNLSRVQVYRVCEESYGFRRLDSTELKSLKGLSLALSHSTFLSQIADDSGNINSDESLVHYVFACESMIIDVACAGDFDFVVQKQKLTL